MVDPVAGQALTDKKSQKKQVKQGQAPWDLASENKSATNRQRAKTRTRWVCG